MYGRLHQSSHLMNTFVHWLLLFAILADFGTVLVGALVCNSTTIDPPAKLKAVYHNWPDSWNITFPPVTFEVDKECQLQMNIPHGYALIISYKLSGPAKSVSILDAVNDEQILDLTDSKTLAFAGDKMLIKLHPKHNVSFSFEYRYSELRVDPLVVDVQSGQQGGYLTIQWSIHFRADTKVSLVPIGYHPAITTDVTRFVAVYDGANINATYLGTFHLFSKARKNIVSSGRSLFVVQMYPYDGVGLFYQDYSDVADVVSHIGLTQYSVFGNNYEILLDATSGPAALYSMQGSGAEFLVSANLLKNSSLSVYLGTKTSNNWNRIVQYRQEDVSNRLPQEFLGEIRTYVLDSGKVTLNLTRNGNLANYYNTRIGWKGFIASKNYPFSGPAERFNEIFNPTYDQAVARQQFRFTYNVKYLSSDAKAFATIYKNSNQYDQIITQGYNGSMTGDSFLLFYDSNNKTGNGFYMEIEISKTAYCISILFSLLVPYFVI